MKWKASLQREPVSSAMRRAGHEACMVGSYTSGCEGLRLRNWELCSTNGNFAAGQHAVQMETLQHTDAVQMGTWQQLANIRLSAPTNLAYRMATQCSLSPMPRSSWRTSTPPWQISRKVAQGNWAYHNAFSLYLAVLEVCMAFLRDKCKVSCQSFNAYMMAPCTLTST